jgi:hypothetical protein
MKPYRHHWRWALLLVLLASVLSSAPPARAQDQSYVYFPETGHFLGGAFRLFHERYGGVAAFGFPVTDEYYRNGDNRVVQYFERARFELLLLPGQPVYIILGNIGREYIQARGYNFERVPSPGPDTATRRYFPETGHTIEGDFKAYWDSIDGPTFLGAPLSERVAEIVDGQQKQVQYFERGRVERNADNSFSRGRLGDPLAPCQQKIRRPADLPPGGPVPEGDPSVCSNPNAAPVASVTPGAGLPGTRFGLRAINFARNEEVALWINLPDNSVRRIEYLATADTNGVVNIGFDTRADDRIGTYSIVASGLRSKREVVATFRLVR